MLQQLNLLRSGKVITSIFTDKDNPTKPTVGMIVGFNKSFVCLSAISPDGFWDGYLLLPNRKHI